MEPSDEFMVDDAAFNAALRALPPPVATMQATNEDVVLASLKDLPADLKRDLASLRDLPADESQPTSVFVDNEFTPSEVSEEDFNDDDDDAAERKGRWAERWLKTKTWVLKCAVWVLFATALGLATLIAPYSSGSSNRRNGQKGLMVWREAIVAAERLIVGAFAGRLLAEAVRKISWTFAGDFPLIIYAIEALDTVPLEAICFTVGTAVAGERSTGDILRLVVHAQARRRTTPATCRRNIAFDWPGRSSAGCAGS